MRRELRTARHRIAGWAARSPDCTMNAPTLPYPKDSPMDPTARLRIATRIHYALLREMGAGIDVGYMLKNDDYAREVLCVCEGCGGEELAGLARRFECATVADAAATRPAALDTMPAPLDSRWAAVSGFDFGRRDSRWAGSTSF